MQILVNSLVYLVYKLNMIYNIPFCPMYRNWQQNVYKQSMNIMQKSYVTFMVADKIM